jgi:hypothetical protein
MVVSGQRHAPAAIYAGERTFVTNWQEAGWDPEPARTRDRGKILSPCVPEQMLGVVSAGLLDGIDTSKTVILGEP